LALHRCRCGQEQQNRQANCQQRYDHFRIHVSFFFAATGLLKTNKGANSTHPRLRHREAPWREARQAAPGGACALGGSLLQIRGFQTRP
jgi:hypothetical protein